MSQTAVHAAPSTSAADEPLSRSLFAGFLTGQVSGFIMAVVVMAVFTLFLGKGPLYPVQVIGSIAFGDAALKGFNASAFVAGLLLHQLGPSLAWGLAFGAAVHALGVRRGAGLAALAVGVGLLSQVIDVNIVLPRAFGALWGHDIWAEQVPAFWSWAAHLVFGLGLLLYPLVEGKLGRSR